MIHPKFTLGRLIATKGAMAKLTCNDMLFALQRHCDGDWGELDPNDRAANDSALLTGSRLLSSYRDSKGTKFWIITEWDRSVTTILLPEEY